MQRNSLRDYRINNNLCQCCGNKERPKKARQKGFYCKDCRENRKLYIHRLRCERGNPITYTRKSRKT